MPPITPVPIEWREAEPAPEAIASGMAPAVKASEVITIGRRRALAPCTADSTIERPLARSSTANSTIRIAFLADRPISVTRPIWK